MNNHIFEIMTKNQWEEVLRMLQRYFDDFADGYQSFKHGRNQKIRSDGKRILNSSIRLAISYIRNKQEVYDLLTGKNTNEQGRLMLIEEFRRPEYFNDDMPQLLLKIGEIISNFGDIEAQN